MNPVLLEILKNAVATVPEEMGRRSNGRRTHRTFKERMDASCALFDAQGRMLAQAEHTHF